MFTQVYPLQVSQGMSMNDSCILVLDAPEVHKQVPMVIGYNEASMLVLNLEQEKVSRPLTHNLICNMMDEYMLTLKEVTIDRFDEGVFYASLHVNDGFSDKRIDSRPSDAIILAILKKCPILMDMNVLNETCMEPGTLDGNLPSNDLMVDNSLEELEELLRECEANEDYEQAAEILKQIEKLKGDDI